MVDVRRTGDTREVIDLLWAILQILERIEKQMPLTSLKNDGPRGAPVTTPPLWVLTWVFWAITAMDPDDPTRFGYHMDHSWTLEECEDRRQQFIDANVPYLSHCESIVAVGRP